KWSEALQIVEDLQHGRLSPFWQGRLRNAEGECHRAAGVAAIQAKEFEQGLEYQLKAAQLLNINVVEVRASILGMMLAEVRSLFAGSKEANGPVFQMIGRVLEVQPNCAEALFWQGLALLRDGQTDAAIEALQAARAPEAVPAPTKPG